jgi:hypothetical protein
MLQFCSIFVCPFWVVQEWLVESSGNHPFPSHLPHFVAYPDEPVAKDTPVSPMITPLPRQSGHNFGMNYSKDIDTKSVVEKRLVWTQLSILQFCCLVRLFRYGCSI